MTSHTEEVTAAGQTDRNVFIVLSGSNHFSEDALAFLSPWSDDLDGSLNLYLASVVCHLPEFPGRDDRGKLATRQGHGIRCLVFLSIVKIGGCGAAARHGLEATRYPIQRVITACCCPGVLIGLLERCCLGLRRGGGPMCLAPAGIAQKGSLPVFRIAAAMPEHVPVGLDCIRVFRMAMVWVARLVTDRTLLACDS